MQFKEYGKENKKVIILIHGACNEWQYFSEVIPILEKKYHIFIPLIPGYVNDGSNFTSTEKIAKDIANSLIEAGYGNIALLYGASMGGAIALRTLVAENLSVSHCIIDGGITPYRLPYIITRFIALRDYLFIRKTQKQILSENPKSTPWNYMTKKTIYNCFKSCNNYSMPKRFNNENALKEYWVMEKEEKDRAWDVKYIKDKFPEAEIKHFSKLNHCELAISRPEKFCKNIDEFIDK